MPAQMEFFHPPVFFRRTQKNSSVFFQFFMAFVANRIGRHKSFSQIHFYSLQNSGIEKFPKRLIGKIEPKMIFMFIAYLYIAVFILRFKKYIENMDVLF